MKLIQHFAFITFALLTSAGASFSQFGTITEANLEALEEDTLIVVLTGQEEFDEALQAVVEKEWDFSPVKYEYEREMRKKYDDGDTLTQFGYFKGRFDSESGILDDVPFIGLVHGFRSSGKYRMDEDISLYLPFSTGGVAPEYAEAFLTLNTKVITQYLEDLQNGDVLGLGSFVDQIKSRYPEIREKKILICSEDLQTKEKNITRTFDFDYSLVYRDEWSRAVLSPTDQLVYYLIPSQKYAYHFLIQPSTGRVFYYAYGMEGSRNEGRGQSTMFRTLGEDEK